MSITQLIIEEAMAASRNDSQQNPDKYQIGMIWRQITQTDVNEAYNRVANLLGEGDRLNLRKVLDTKVGTWEPAILSQNVHIYRRGNLGASMALAQKQYGDCNYEWRPFN